MSPDGQTFGDKACHSERSAESFTWPVQILRCAQNDRPDRSHVPSQEVLSPNTCQMASAVSGYVREELPRLHALREGHILVITPQCHIANSK